jgi:hypothetical protein
MSEAKVSRFVLSAATRIGMPIDAYLVRIQAGEKWCTRCRCWHPRCEFGEDKHRYDGLAACCLNSRRPRQLSLQLQSKRSGLLVPTRDGDKLQARARVNYLVIHGRIPRPDSLPCTDCGGTPETHGRRHEYDHARGYSAEHQLYVEAVCSLCHSAREKARGCKQQADRDPATGRWAK